MVRIVGFKQGADNDLVERASPIDMMELASDVGPVPLQVGAVQVFESGAQLAASRVREALADRVCGIPRLRQQLVPAPPGCGRPAGRGRTAGGGGRATGARRRRTPLPAAPGGGGGRA